MVDGEAAQLGVALPTMSQTIRGLEERLGVRLFNRTTRSVALTEAGARLLSEIQPILARLSDALESVNSFREKPMGSLRLAVARPFAAQLVALVRRAFSATASLLASPSECHRTLLPASQTFYFRTLRPAHGRAPLTVGRAD